MLIVFDKLREKPGRHFDFFYSASSSFGGNHPLYSDEYFNSDGTQIGGGRFNKFVACQKFEFKVSLDLFLMRRMDIDDAITQVSFFVIGRWSCAIHHDVGCFDKSKEFQDVFYFEASEDALMFKMKYM